ncbi:trypco2 family protein [Amycolatopsis orientalis]|uniref:trypco2 family protein n=1 Tax=Amycolatopsis orientalis TaxID=31958 RepID=UPI0003FA196E|nr:trypco2 family protein [Amycolatopsis orientalis]
MAVELSEMIGRLRDELTVAMNSGDGAELRFELGSIELELTVAVTKEASPTAKVKFWLVEAGVDGKFSSAATQKIKLTLDPRRAGQLDRKPFVSGTEEPGER